jgi:hypothetical protein
MHDSLTADAVGVSQTHVTVRHIGSSMAHSGAEARAAPNVETTDVMGVHRQKGLASERPDAQENGPATMFTPKSSEQARSAPPSADLPIGACVGLTGM